MYYDFWHVLASLNGVHVEQSEKDQNGIYLLLTEPNKTFDYAVHRKTYKIAVPPQSTDGFYYELARNSDVILGVKCDAKFEIFIGEHSVANDDALLLLAAQYERARIHIVPNHGQEHVIITYDAMQMHHVLHEKLLNNTSNVWITKHLVYKNGFTSPLGFYVGQD